MNSFKLYLNDSEIKGVVFPFRFAELLDERLDEAYVDFYNRVEFYEPLTEAMIEIKQDISQDETLADTLYFVVGNDNSVEYPAESGIYKHSVYLIERTKLLDGIVCSSLTFTNSLEINCMPPSIKNDEAVYTNDGVSSNITDLIYAVSNPVVLDIKKNVYEGTEVNLPNAKTIAEKLIKKEYENPAAYNAKGEVLKEGYINNVKYMTSVIISFDDGSASFQCNYAEDVKFTAKGHSIKVIYVVVYNNINYPGSKDEEKFTICSMITLTLDVYKNRRKMWTITDCINRVLECAKPLFGSESPEYHLYQDDATKYDKILAPEFSMTQCTLREQLKVIGSFIHAEPYLDNRNVIHFKPLGTTGECSLKDKDYVYSGAKTDINQYCTEVRSNIQNHIISSKEPIEDIIEPGHNLWRSLRSPDMNKRVTTDNGVALTDQPIYSVKYLECGVYTSSDWYVTPTDITKYVFEETAYNILSSYDGEYPNTKKYALYYTIGQPNINGLFFQVPHAKNTAEHSQFAICHILQKASGQRTAQQIYKILQESPCTLLFRIRYTAIRSSTVSHGKQFYDKSLQHFTQIYNQSERMIESQYFGENLKGLAARLGNPEKERTYILKNFSDIPETGQMLYDYTEDGQIRDSYAISAVTAEIMPNHIKCTVGLSKDFNRISEYVGISSIKRLYEISEREVYNRDILIKHNLVIATKTTNFSSDFADSFYLGINGFRDIFLSSNVDGVIKNKISNVKVESYRYSGETPISTVTLPVMTTTMGNTISFMFSFKDNYSAGNKLTSVEKDEITGDWSEDVRYTDEHGKVYWMNINYFNSSLELPKVSNKLPESNLVYGISYIAKTSAKLLLRKDGRERISVTYEIEAKTADPNIIIGSDFMKYCRYVNDSSIPQLHLYVFNSDYPLNKFDREFHPRYKIVDGIEKNIDDFYTIQQSWTTLNSESHFTLNPYEISADGTKKAINNKGFGWAIVTSGSTDSFDILDEDDQYTTQIVRSDGKILILCTAKNTADIKLDFFLTRK